MPLVCLGEPLGFTVIAVLSLAIGIGGNAAMFSLVDKLLVQPLPYLILEPDHLVRVTGVYPRAAVPVFQQQSRTMDAAAVSVGSDYNLTGQGEAIRIFGSAASANLFSVLGAPIARGRSFEPGEDLPGRDSVPGWPRLRRVHGTQLVAGGALRVLSRV